ncbi:MAG: L-rhamnose isomerase [Candidatus Aminicenantes bacterium]|nr:L-rhamnose isomerase [Candidatus Aminicenantes bacterium]
MSDERAREAFEIAKETYAGEGVDVENALSALADIPISLHCWQGDDVGGFEQAAGTLGGGLAVTGAYPGKARTAGELRDDLDLAFSLIPGRRRLNLHAIYGEFGPKHPGRDRIGAADFARWREWAGKKNLPLDFNATCFSHPMAESGLTLSHPDPAVRRFWIDHVIACREVAAGFGRTQKSPCLHNLWIPDGMKETPADRAGFRTRLEKSLDEIYQTAYPDAELRDSLEGKLFGLGSEAFVVGSNEFYAGYAVSRRKFLCLDLGHFHPTESVADKISALLPFVPGLVIHFSRGLRWDSDHVVLLTDEISEVCGELVRAAAWDRVNLALDYFDGSLNRIGAWVIGARAVLKGLLQALLQPWARLEEADRRGDGMARLSIRENAPMLPLGAVWDEFCRRFEVPAGTGFVEPIRRYEDEVLRRRV